MGEEYGLEFRWVEIHAARDHYVAFAITEVEEVGTLSLVQSS